MLAPAITARRAVIAGAIISLVSVFLYIALDPSVPFLVPSLKSSWIAYPSPVSLGTKAPGRTGALFRRRFALEQPLDARIVLRALRAAEARLDGRLALSQADLGRWKEPVHADLGSLAAGPHELVVAVVDENGPPLLQITGAGLSTGAGWEASLDGKHWEPAREAERYEPAALSREFPTAARAFAGRLPFLLPLFAFGFLWARRRRISASGLRWGLLAAWAILSFESLFRLPMGVGYDVGGHMDYARFIVETGRLPLAPDGWQMFQAPLYYLLSAPLYWLTHGAERALRVLPLACGALQVELGYRAARRVYPDREDLQAVGTLFAACLPMSLYLSQSAGNEPLAGAFTAAAIVLAWSGATPLVVGLALGLALLTKATAVLIVLPICAWVYSKRRDWREVVWVAGAALAVAGWYYLRNWAELGTPFVGGWDPARRIVWWQEPGYRTWRHLLSFGEALSRPVYSAVAGFWDSLYSTLWLDGCLSARIRFEARPPWHYGWLIAGSWLALVPSACLLGGLWKAVKGGDACLRFSAACVALYLAAMLALYVKLPIYSAGKATYALGLTPCLAALVCAGFDTFTRRPAARAVLWGAMLCWAVAAYSSYLVV